MAKITRQTQKIFASSASNNGVFGSAQIGTKVTSNDLPTLMGLAAFLTGWNDAVLGDKKFPPLEEFQALDYINTYQLAYLLQEGIPEYDSGTTYYANSIVKKAGTYEVYGSIGDDNIGNALPVQTDSAYWQYLGNLADLKNIGVSNSTPVGTILDFGGTSAPTGYLLCDGSAVSRVTYSDLFSAIGTTWGNGDGSTTFNLPSLARRVTVGSGGTGTATLANTIGSTGGAETHQLTTAEMPTHTHGTERVTSCVEPWNIGVGSDGAMVSGNTSSAGGGQAHNNMQPSAVVMKIIKY